MKKAFSVFVFGTYDRFLPYFVYSIERAYPGCDVLIFYNAQLSSSVKQYLGNKPFVKTFEDFYAEQDHFKNYKIRGGGKKLLRHVIPYSYFEAYDYVYFGDVDIVLLNEKIDLFSFHIKQAKTSGVSFSNKVRPLPDGSLSKRLTGLHFIITKPYYEKITPVIEKIFSDKAYQKQLISKVNRDEEFLYAINQEATSFNPMKVANNVTPLHGVHLGNFRHSVTPNIPIVSYHENRVAIRAQLQEMLRDKAFKEILQQFYCKEMIRVLLYFDISMPFALYIKFQFSEAKKKLRKLIKG